MSEILTRGQGFTVEKEGSKIKIVFDPLEDFGPSRSGKTTIIASSRGATPIPVGDEVISLNLNVYRKK